RTTTYHDVQFLSRPQRQLHPSLSVLTSLQQPQLQDHLKKTSLLASLSGNACPLMNYWSFGISLRWTSTHVIRFSGGMGDVLSSQISLALRMISSPFQVAVEVLILSRFLFIINTLFVTGSAVAVERIFSGGRDTISLRRASLKPETIRMLMLVKRKLILAREEIKLEIHVE